MDDQTVQFPGTPEGQPANVSQPVEPAQGIASVDPVEEKINRLFQSNTDKMAERLKRQVLDELKPVLQSGSPTEPSKEGEQSPVSPGETKVPAPVQQKVSPVDQQTVISAVQSAQEALEKAFKCKIFQGDPEVEGLDKSGDPKGYILTLAAALEKKASRLQEPPPQNRMPMAGAGGTGVNDVQQINDPGLLLRLGLNGKQ